MIVRLVRGYEKAAMVKATRELHKCGLAEARVMVDRAIDSAITKGLDGDLLWNEVATLIGFDSASINEPDDFDVPMTAIR